MLNLELKEKAYIINSSCLDEPWFSDPTPYYGTRGQAKLKILSDHDGHKHSNGEDLDFLNIKISRSKEDDKFIYEGEIVDMSRIKLLEKRKKRELLFLSILNDKSITHCYIRKDSYYRPNHCGYTSMVHRAGVYTKLEGVNEARGCDDIDLVIINNQVHNKMIQGEIKDLETRIIKN